MFAQGDRSSAYAKQLRVQAGAWLKSKREAKNLTQRELAELVGFKYYTFISQVEGGAGRVPSDCYEKYAQALGIDAREFALQMLKYYDPFVYAALEGNPTSKAPTSKTKKRREPAALVDVQ